MRYLLSFFEGIVTFISPCLLPMLPVYVSYFAAGDEQGRSKPLTNALGFVSGFTLVFLALGLFAGAVGGFLHRYSTALNIVLGAVVVLFGLSFMGVIRPLFGGAGRSMDMAKTGFFRSLLFGAVFSVSWTPCVGAFLGSALALASASGSALTGTLMLLCYSAGLGIPFVLSAVLLGQLRGAFDAIKKHYKTINLICGGFLVVTGILMMTGLLQKVLGAVGV
ncbi:MAG: cytochrome c biogenesis protein CcdA [Oscillospiraceae bacterium]|nr:cytochrome c biogenesis protein CcdA [Oscillospiraceae bacterium]